MQIFPQHLSCGIICTVLFNFISHQKNQVTIHNIEAYLFIYCSYYNTDKITWFAYHFEFYYLEERICR